MCEAHLEGADLRRAFLDTTAHCVATRAQSRTLPLFAPARCCCWLRLPPRTLPTRVCARTRCLHRCTLPHRCRRWSTPHLAERSSDECAKPAWAGVLVSGRRSADAAQYG